MIDSVEKKNEIDETMLWHEFVVYLQKNFNSIYIKTFDVNYKMKNCRQRSDQTMTEFINYINTFEIQLSIQFLNYVKYVNLLKFLHSYFRNAIICWINKMMFKTKLKKLVQFAKKNEWMFEILHVKTQKKTRKLKKNEKKIIFLSTRRHRSNAKRHERNNFTKHNDEWLKTRRKSKSKRCSSKWS